MEVEAVGFRYTERAPWLFQDLTFTIPSGTTALLGPSGSGKSTLLALLAGWLEPTEGLIAERPDELQWVLQSPIGSPRRSALSHVALPFLARGLEVREADDKALAILEQLELASVSQTPLRNLSGGEAQRLMLAKAIAASPGLMLVDEPTAQLDSKNAGTVIDVITGINTGSVAMVVATHDLELAAACNFVIDLRAR